MESFVEKPDLDTARVYFADRSYLWNAGMFIARADVLLAEIEAQDPELHAGLVELAEAWDDRDGADRSSTACGRRCARSRSTTSWPSPRPRRGGSPSCPVTSSGTTWAISRASRSSTPTAARTTSRSSDRTPRPLGCVQRHRRVADIAGHQPHRVQDIVVVDTPDALLVTTSQHAQRVKGVVDALKLNGRGDVL